MKKSAPKIAKLVFLALASCAHQSTQTNDPTAESKPPRLNSDDKARIVVLYVADIHGRLRTDSDGLGGYARIRGWIDKERAAAGSKTDVLVIGGGDMTDKGSMPCLVKNDVPCMPLLAEMGIDFSVIGNHEIQRPVTDTKNLLTLSKIRWASANVSPITGSRFWESLIDYKGPKSGLSLRFVPFTKELDQEAHAARYKDFKFAHRPKSAEDWKPYLPKNGSYILVHHQPTEDDEAMLDSLCKSDLKKPLILLKADDENFKWRKQMGCVEGVEPGPHGKVIARLVLEAGADQSAVLKEMSFVEMNGEVPENAAMKASIEALYKKFAADADVELGTAARDHSPEAMAQWMSDTYKYLTKADVAIVNGGAVKSGLKAGPLTRERMRMVFPYANQLMGLDWSYESISKSLCKAAARKKEGDADFGSELYLAGAKLVDVGTEKCRLESQRRGTLKIVVDDYVFKKSARWLGQDLSKMESWKFGVDTPLAIERRLKRDPKSL